MGDDRNCRQIRRAKATTTAAAAVAREMVVMMRKDKRVREREGGWEGKKGRGHMGRRRGRGKGEAAFRRRIHGMQD